MTQSDRTISIFIILGRGSLLGKVPSCVELVWGWDAVGGWQGE